MSDSEELAREAEAARARLSDTAERIRDRMSPGQMMDEVLNQFRNGDGGQMLSNMQHQVRDNPMALALVGTGLAWLMLGSGRQAPRARPYYPDYPSAGSEPVDTWREDTFRGDAWREDDVWREDTLGSTGRSTAGSGSLTGSSASGMRTQPSVTGSAGTGFSSASRTDYSQPDSSRSESSGLGSMAESVKDTVKDSVTEMAHGASEALSSARNAVGEGLHGAGDRAQRLAHDVRSAGGHALRDVRHSAAGMGHQARGTFLDVLEREPLVIGAIGVAVGAALGAFLPATDVERRHLGPTGEALKEKATELVDRGVARAKDAAAEVYETARDEADRQGLLPGDKPIADKIGSVVRAAGETVGDIAERNAPDAHPDSASGTGSSAAKSGTSDTGTRAGTSGTGTGAAGSSTSPGTGSGTGSGTGQGTSSGTGTGSGSGGIGGTDPGAPGQPRNRT